MKNSEEIELLIEKFLSNNCSREEYLEVIEILRNPNHDSGLRSVLLKKWDGQDEKAYELSEEEKKDIRQTLSDIHHEINLSEEKWEFRPDFRKVSGILIKIAAILFFPLLFASIWYFISSRNPYKSNDSYITINTPAGSKIKTELPDGTVVWQNSGSTVRYPKNFTRRNRQVIMTGEAFFDVKPDKLHPFFVNTPRHLIKVTGTKFNVSAYDNEGTTSIVLVSGRIYAKDLNIKSAHVYSMVPGDRLEKSCRNREILSHHVDLEKYISWIEGKLVFRDDPLEEILKKLSRWYNVEIVVNDPGNKFKDLPFTLTIKDESFSQIMEYIKHAAPLFIKEEKMALQPDGSFNKQKYIITYRK